MTGPALPLCYASAIILNDWQQHKLAPVLVVWFTFCFRAELRYSLLVFSSASKNATLYQCLFPLQPWFIRALAEKHTLLWP